MIASLLAVAGTFPSSIMAAGASGTLTINAFVVSGCNVDNASLHFAKHETAGSKGNKRETDESKGNKHEIAGSNGNKREADESNGNNRASGNVADSQYSIPLSVTCKNSTPYGNYSTSLATPRALKNSYAGTDINQTSRVAVTISY